MISELERKALKLIKECEKEGVPQNELWKNLNTTSREGYRIFSRLEKGGLIRRVKELHKGRWTYRLFPVIKEAKNISYDKLNECPCFDCKELFRCGLGNDVSPSSCLKQNTWLKKIAEERSASEGK